MSLARVLIVTQGTLGEELAQCAHIIAGGEFRIETLSLDWDESLEESERKLAKALGDETRGAEAGVLILTDMPGGTPFNVAAKFARRGRVEVLSGVNLAMLVRLCCPGRERRTIEVLAEWLQEKGRQSICRAEAAEPTGDDTHCG